jgi:acetylornithine deacetylase/succinyl-diaminopimelate desuccinylase-like protein
MPPRFRIPFLCLVCLSAASLQAQTTLTPDQTEARELFKELIEINSSYKGGSTTPAAHAIARRFLAAGFPAADVRVLGPAGDKDSSVVVRMQGTSKTLKPILLIAHLDVVEALRSDWSLDPYKLTEKDGFFYGRGTSDTSPSPLTPEVMVPVEAVTRRLWPGVPVIPLMETGATDGAYLRAAGMPTYGVSGVFIDIDDVRAHGRDERIIVRSFYDGVEYIYQLVKEVATH